MKKIVILALSAHTFLFTNIKSDIPKPDICTCKNGKTLSLFAGECIAELRPKAKGGPCSNFCEEVQKSQMKSCKSPKITKKPVTVKN